MSLNKIDTYLKDRLEKVVFIELKENAHIEDKFQMLKNAPIPILVDELVKPVKENAENYDISLASMARGMIFLMGIDSQFHYIDVYRQFLYALNPNVGEYIAYEGLKLAEQGKFTDALIHFKALMTLDKDNINGIYNYGRCCQDIANTTDEKNKRKDFTRESIKAFEILIEKYPDFAPAYYFLGFHYANQKLFKKAQLIWEKCLKLNIDDQKRKELIYQLEALKDQVQYEEGYTYILNGQPVQGIKKLKPLIKKHSNWWNVLFFIGLGYRQLGKYEKAIQYFEQILLMKPTQLDVLNELGLCYASLRDFHKAEKYFKTALKYKEDDSEILANLGTVYIELGELSLAEKLLNKSIQLNPNDEITRQWLKKLNCLKEK